MSEELFEFIEAHRPIIDEALAEQLPLSSQRGAEQLNSALEYAVFPGGKRLRPVLTLIATALVGGSLDRAMPAACAVEFLHTSSLILDDLPAMDDADLRRNRAALHRVYGEDIATLAALALLNRAYVLFAQAGGAHLLSEAARAIGEDGMIGGQAADLESRTRGGSVEMLASRSLKTTALMRLTLSAGAIACEASDQDRVALAEFGECLGAAYQIRDDLLDKLGDSDLAGKTVGQDERHLRHSFTAALGLEGASHMAMSLIEQAKSSVAERFGDKHEARLLIDAADIIAGGVDRLKIMSHSMV
ncbi:MAG TPA: polyprenyl synthetase family protein [Blastocatellia bacterium]|nr:polyprenyl synthetase family protein [Blastocatellia bacterium]